MSTHEHSIPYAYATTATIVIFAGTLLAGHFYRMSLPGVDDGHMISLVAGLFGIAVAVYTRTCMFASVAFRPGGGCFTLWVLYSPFRLNFKGAAGIRLDGDTVYITMESGTVRAIRLWGIAVSSPCRESLRRWMASHAGASPGDDRPLPPLRAAMPSRSDLLWMAGTWLLCAGLTYLSIAISKERSVFDYARKADERGALRVRAINEAGITIAVEYFRSSREDEDRTLAARTLDDFALHRLNPFLWRYGNGGSGFSTVPALDPWPENAEGLRGTARDLRVQEQVSGLFATMEGAGGMSSSFLTVRTQCTKHWLLSMEQDEPLMLILQEVRVIREAQAAARVIWQGPFQVATAPVEQSPDGQRGYVRHWIVRTPAAPEVAINFVPGQERISVAAIVPVVHWLSARRVLRDEALMESLLSGGDPLALTQHPNVLGELRRLLASHDQAAEEKMTWRLDELQVLLTNRPLLDPSDAQREKKILTLFGVGFFDWELPKKE